MRENGMLRKAYDALFNLLMSLVERDIVPDFVIRTGIHYLLSQRDKEARTGGAEEQLQKKQAFVEELKSLPIAIETQVANEQHYEVPTEYFLLVLGKHLKYSSCLFPSQSSTLDEAEETMLELCCQRAELADGQDILELGCGWGSMCLYVAAKYPKSRVTAVSNSATQKAFIDEQARDRRLTNLTVITADVVNFDVKQKFDRVVSVEMFEHCKNYQLLLKRISSWLKPDGLLFVHIFVHKSLPYHFEARSIFRNVNGEDDWMTKYFFTGGTMPSADLLLHFQDDLALQRQWNINGKQYSRTLEAWLSRQDSHRSAIMPIMKKTYGEHQGLKWWVYWRLFYMACSELFRYNDGNEWFVSHYLFKQKSS